MAVIVVDPGHGGNSNVGGSSPNNSAGPAGTLEKTITLEFGLELRDVLVRQGHTVVMTRDSDVNLGLRARAAVARAQGADVFISLHCNGWHAADVQGSETWLHTRHNAASDRLAAAVQKQLVAATGLRDRGVKSKGLGVLDPDHHDPRTAACLVEVSFLTDPAEEQRLNDASYRRRIVAHLAAGIGAYVGVPPTVREVLDIGADASLPAEDAVKPTAGVSAAPSEPDLWQVQAVAAEAALGFAIGFLGCRMGASDNQPLDAAANGRLRVILRAVSIVESRHGTQGANRPARDPFQCGNPGDAWWRELTGRSGNGSRFVRGPNLTNLWAKEVAAAAEATAGFDTDAAFSKLANPNNGPRNRGFTPAHSYVWGILYLIHRINTTAGQPTFACRDLSRRRLIDGAVRYNGGGVADYRERIQSALREIGGAGQGPLVAVADTQAGQPATG